ncbi:MAG TPA: hypothetical protein VJT81_05245 [Burkholderiales bacterium]|nr:hypothetical protein [Burkholderiales bacterium]
MNPEQKLAREKRESLARRKRELLKAIAAAPASWGDQIRRVLARKPGKVGAPTRNAARDRGICDAYLEFELSRLDGKEMRTAVQFKNELAYQHKVAIRTIERVIKREDHWISEALEKHLRFLLQMKALKPRQQSRNK